MSNQNKPAKRLKSKLEKTLDVLLVLAVCFAVLSVWKPWQDENLNQEEILKAVNYQLAAVGRMLEKPKDQIL
ncbi:hypothetical protein C4J81_04675 [Deltaproteobacteria bacterium Smac51]|nr:hypothetical protein C4J81_04675 [Deltaproteobacteria bacterium Smac51]